MKILICEGHSTLIGQRIKDLLEDRIYNVAITKYQDKEIRESVCIIGGRNSPKARKLVESLVAKASKVEKLRPLDYGVNEHPQIGKFGNWPKPRTKKNKNFKK